MLIWPKELLTLSQWFWAMICGSDNTILRQPSALGSWMQDKLENVVFFFKTYSILYQWLCHCPPMNTINQFSPLESCWKFIQHSSKVSQGWVIPSLYCFNNLSCSKSGQGITPVYPQGKDAAEAPWWPLHLVLSNPWIAEKLAGRDLGRAGPAFSLKLDSHQYHFYSVTDFSTQKSLQHGDCTAFLGDLFWFTALVVQKNCIICSCSSSTFLLQPCVEPRGQRGATSPPFTQQMFIYTARCPPFHLHR